MSPSGLLEMTRRRSRPPLHEVLCRPCGIGGARLGEDAGDPGLRGAAPAGVAASGAGRRAEYHLEGLPRGCGGSSARPGQAAALAAVERVSALPIAG